MQNSSLSSPTRHIFHTLDVLRLVAAMAVMMRHMPDGGIKAILPGAYLAVDLFFCLSGFVLAHAYQHRFRSGIIAFGGFTRVRVIRLWPLYLLATAIGAIPLFLTVLHRGAGALVAWCWSVVLAIFMLPTPAGLSLAGYAPFSFCGPAWSLFWEMVVGLLYGAIAKSLTGRWLASLLALGAVLVMISSAADNGLDAGWTIDTFYSGGARALWGFFAGVALYRLWSAKRISWFQIPAWASSLAMLVLFAVDPGSWRWLFDIVAALIFFPAMVMASTDAPRSPPLLIVRRLARASYAVYVLHVPMIVAFEHVFGKFGYDARAAGIWGSFAFAALIMPAALVLDRLYDMPVRAWLSARFVSRRLE